MLEKAIEQKFRRLVEGLGGECYKFTSPARVGVPDRLVAFPGGRIFFVEFKAPGKKLSPRQEAEIQRLRELGNVVHVIDRPEQIGDVLDGHA